MVIVGGGDKGGHDGVDEEEMVVEMARGDEGRGKGRWT